MLLTKSYFYFPSCLDMLSSIFMSDKYIFPDTTSTAPFSFMVFRIWLRYTELIPKADASSTWAN